MTVEEQITAEVHQAVQIAAIKAIRDAFGNTVVGIKTFDQFTLTLADRLAALAKHDTEAYLHLLRYDYTQTEFTSIHR
jgi:hypothetical protein